jgi:uracil-DNA glycosylase
MNEHDDTVNRATRLWTLLDDAQALLQGTCERTEAAQVPDLSACAAALTRGEEPEIQTGISQLDMESLRAAVHSCTRCGLSRTRRNPVPGAGAARPQVMIIGEAPGAQEDESGIPFVGRSGSYLDRWMHAIGFTRDQDLYMTNIVKCRPPENRDPSADEQAACLPYLLRQIELLQPKMLLCLGRVASQILLDTTDSLGRLREQTHSFHGIPLVVTYHPSAVLRYPEKFRAPVWEDLKRLRSCVNELNDEE